MLNEGPSSKQSYRSGIAELISSREVGFELSVTLNFNQRRTFVSAKGKLGEWAQRVDNLYLGRQWMNVPSDRRVFFIAFCENPETNIHFHVILRLPHTPWHRLRQEKFAGYRKLRWHKRQFEGLWEELVPPGSCDVKAIHDLDGLARYDTKQVAARI